MCGIAGILMRQGTPDQASLEQAASRLQHRGPDEGGVHIEGALGLVHTRLSIIDLQGGRQPLRSADNQIHLVANGEVYNYVELRQQYAKQAELSLTSSDSESIIHVYEAEGQKGFKRLNGMFSFALFDSQCRELFLVRDRLGIKPLFYAELPDRLVFASEIKALLALMPKQPEINPAALNQFLQNQFHSGRETIFKGVMRVMAGESLRVDASLSVQPTQYWSALDVQPNNIGLDEALYRFEELLAVVMAEHMRADVPFGLFLSGGIDSSVLLAELSRMHTQRLQTFSLGYVGTNMKDELLEAEALAQHFGTEHLSLKVSRDDLFNRIVHSVWAADDLMRDYASLPTSLLSEAAAKQLKVVFSGEGGDEVFAGYRRYRPSPERWIKSLVLGTGGFRTRGQWRSSDAKSVFGSNILRHSARTPFKEAWSEAPTSWSDMQRSQYVDLKTALPDNLFVKADRMMMGFGLEGRVPFADHRLVEFGLSLPDNLKLNGKQGKWLIRQWASKALPPEHLARPKRGFYVPVKEWLQGDFLARLTQKLQRNEAINTWFQPSGVSAILQKQHKNGGASRELWCLMQFAIWHRLFVEQAGVKPDLNEDPIDWIS